MSTTTDQEPDSRTVAVGRKRAHGGSRSPGEVLTIEDSPDEGSIENSRKRMKHSSGEDSLEQHASPPWLSPLARGIAETSSSLQPPNTESREKAEHSNGGTPSVVAWNTGIQSGLRTSFARSNKSSAVPRKLDPSPAHDKGMPADQLTAAQPQGRPTAGPENTDEVTGQSQNHEALKKMKNAKKAAKNAKNAQIKADLAAQEVEAESVSLHVPATAWKGDDAITQTEDTSFKSPIYASDSSNGQMMQAENDGALLKANYELQMRYYPSHSMPFEIRCMSCSSEGHKTYDCPSRTCGTCGVMDAHLTYACPRNQRCDKCREQGHSKADCPEKLAMPRGERECDICQSADHLESFCHLIWRSYQPSPDEIRRVQDIQMYCYCCGSQGHYGTECGLPHGKLLSGGHTWTKANRDQYIDHNSGDRNVSAGKEHSIPAKPAKDYSIKGKAIHINLDDSDDESSSFIRPKINSAPAKRGQIIFQQAQSEVDFMPLITEQRSPPGARSMPTRSLPSRLARPDFYWNQRDRPDLSFRPPQYREESARYGRERTFSPPPASSNGQSSSRNETRPGEDYYSHRITDAEARALSRRTRSPAPPAPRSRKGMESSRGRGIPGRGGSGGGGSSRGGTTAPGQGKKKKKQRSHRPNRGTKGQRQAGST